MAGWQEALGGEEEGSAAPRAVPPHLGTRYDTDGRFLPQAGNTVVCQLVPGSASEAALVDLGGALRALPHGDRFAFTPQASWHMTVFDCIIDTARNPGNWAAGLPTDAPVAVMTAALAARLDGFAPPPAFAMAVTAVTPLGLSLAGATPQDERNARAWRDALSRALGIRRANHESYPFHLTMAYPLAWIPRGAIAGLEKQLAALTTALRRRIAVLDLGPPAFCRFDDMTAFPPVRPL